MDGGRAGLQLDPVGAALFDDLRHLHVQLLRRGHDDAVARGPDLLQSVGDLVVLLFHVGQGRQKRQKLPVVFDLKARALPQNLIEQSLVKFQLTDHGAGAQVDGMDTVAADLLQLRHLGNGHLRLGQTGDALGVAPQGRVEGGLERMLQLQSPYPSRQKHLHLAHGEGAKKLTQKLLQLRLAHGLTVGGNGAHAVGVGDVLPQGLGLRRFGPGGIHQNYKGLPRGLHIPDGPLLGADVVRTGNVRDGAVGGDHHAHGAVILHDLPGAQLGSLRHGDRFVLPRRRDHPRLVVFHGTDGSVYHIAHRVDEPHGQGRRAVRGDLDRVLRDKFRLCGHDGLAGAALRQLILGPFPLVQVADVRNDQLLHKPLDESGFSRPHRPDYPDIDVAARASGNVGVEITHNDSLPQSLVVHPMHPWGRLCGQNVMAADGIRTENRSSRSARRGSRRRCRRPGQARRW